MRLFRTGLFVLFIGTAFAASALAQKTRPRKAQPAKPPVSRAVAPLDVRAAREKVEIQRSNTSRFIDVLGPIAQEIECRCRNCASRVSGQMMRRRLHSVARHARQSAKTKGLLREYEASRSHQAEETSLR